MLICTTPTQIIQLQLRKLLHHYQHNNSVLYITLIKDQGHCIVKTPKPRERICTLPIFHLPIGSHGSPNKQSSLCIIPPNGSRPHHPHDGHCKNIGTAWCDYHRIHNPKKCITFQFCYISSCFIRPQNPASTTSMSIKRSRATWRVWEYRYGNFEWYVQNFPCSPNAPKASRGVLWGTYAQTKLHNLWLLRSLDLSIGWKVWHSKDFFPRIFLLLPPLSVRHTHFKVL